MEYSVQWLLQCQLVSRISDLDIWVMGVCVLCGIVALCCRWMILMYYLLPTDHSQKQSEEIDPEKKDLITTLNELQVATEKEEVDKINKTINLFHQNVVRNKQLLSELYKSGIECITQTIKRIIIQKSILDKPLLEKSLYLLDERMKDVPNEVSKSVEELFGKQGTSLCSQSNQDIQELQTSTGFTIQHLKEIVMVLKNRVYQLKKTIQYPEEDLSDRLRKYKRDQQFRIVLEMLLADIANIYATCSATLDLMNKSAKLQRGLKLRNMLDHGDPFIEVIGDIFDSHDLPTELLSKPRMVAEDCESIEALYKLFQHNIDYQIIKKGKRDEMNGEQNQLYDQLLESARWEKYAELIKIK